MQPGKKWSCDGKKLLETAGLTLTVRRKKPAVVVNSQGKGQTGPADPLAGVESVQPGRLRDKELERLDKIQAIRNSSSVADTIIHTSLDLSDASSEPSTSSRSNAHITLGSGAASPDEAAAKAIGMEEHLDALLQHASRAKQTASGFTRLQEPGAGGAVSDKSAAAKPFQAQLSELLSHYGVPSSKQSLAKWVQGTVRKCVDRTPCGSALRSASNARPRWLSKCLPKPGAGSASKAPEPQFRDALDHVGRQQREGIEILRRARRAVAGVGAAA
ncbi:hypothetical protein EMIHUDRAFT_200313 [Emiliania huxleyi CCMP1516]|uniref:Uncharacterized protein n=2 Tax=Emiliania huxleyi TaxID=2903 RepID=A0A0D3KVC9_EMIH1|nr:hypothetical protein EMIHUDRAFT_249641 [Emiliania huxleyi CCMP1516]XP_005792143.1 hypothetical protein EMIHUDRAFT_200313 [Emiliania huxleyi CCMP1516]EOD06854.1 hypothetical protein EMIHUDRAFT_249641 [Emiliania huxleyi CCMP1516]EOD39714.1 hypothetical protein EMIHUDRAFT_200313 [Emiliania huxleyi CCMP1516]|eukprot:XP_005759283.1 hypothetical protein EMIHUDRAFT_249641 [Emiliania huxleyi CCMP1516]